MKKVKLFVPILLSASLFGCGMNSASNTMQPITVQHLNETNVAKADTTILKPAENPTADIETISQQNQNIAPVNNGKGNSVAITSAIKNIAIDAGGNLVITSANGSSQTVGSVQGVPGPAGPQGPQGPAGMNGTDGHDGHNGEDGKDGKDGKDGINGKDGVDGKDGIDGKDGRGIDHCELDDDKNLIIYYTDNTSQNVGSLLVPNDTPAPTPDPTPSEDEVPIYEKIGYKLVSEIDFPKTFSLNTYIVHMIPMDAHDFEFNFTYTLKNVDIELVEINQNNPSKKYKYKFKGNASIEYDSLPIICNICGNEISELGIGPGDVSIGLDYTYKGPSTDGMLPDSIDSNTDKNMFAESYFYSSVPFVAITDASFHAAFTSKHE